MTSPIDARSRDLLCGILEADFNLEPAATADAVSQVGNLIDVLAAPDYFIADDAVIPRDAREAFRQFGGQLDALVERWERMGDRARNAIGGAAFLFAQEAQTGLGGYPDAVSREDGADPEFYAAMAQAFSGHGTTAAQCFGALLQLLQEIVAAAGDEVRNLPRNAAARTHRRVALVANVLRVLPLDNRPPKYIDTPPALFCRTALAAFDAALHGARPEGAAVNFAEVYFAAIDLVYG